MASDSADTQSGVPSVTLEAWLVTDVGMVREHNEDSAAMVPANGFFIVADGMGGHAAGEVASAMAAETVKKTLEEAKAEIDAFKAAPSDGGRRALVTLLQNAVLQAHQAVYQRGQSEPDKQGMGTTLDVVLVAGPEAFVAHVGDSRTYLVREGRTSQITTDHTVAEVLVIEGKLTIEEAQVSPLRTILVNAIGVSADVGVEMAHVTLKRGDRLLLCSDGLHDYFPSEEEIATKLSSDKPGDALKDMVELAKTRGGHDNITGIAVQIMEVVEGVPERVEPDSTQPVEVPVANPFLADEPTETAFPPPVPSGSNAAINSAAAGQMKATQPMRAVGPDPKESLETLARHVAGNNLPRAPELAKTDPGVDTEASTSPDQPSPLAGLPVVKAATAVVAGGETKKTEVEGEPAAVAKATIATANTEPTPAQTNADRPTTEKIEKIDPDGDTIDAEAVTPKPKP